MNSKKLATTLTLPLAGFVAGGFLVGGIAAATTPEPVDTTACIVALDDAIEIDGYMVDALDASGRATKAALHWNSSGIDEETEFIKSITPGVQAARASFEANSDECRAGQ